MQVGVVVDLQRALTSDDERLVRRDGEPLAAELQLHAHMFGTPRSSRYAQAVAGSVEVRPFSSRIFTDTQTSSGASSITARASSAGMTSVGAPGSVRCHVNETSPSPGTSSGTDQVKVTSFRWRSPSRSTGLGTVSGTVMVGPAVGPGSSPGSPIRRPAPRTIPAATATAATETTIVRTTLRRLPVDSSGPVCAEP